MELKHQKSQYRGVLFDHRRPSRPWRAWIRLPERCWLGRFTEELTAALAADFSRYVLFGIDYNHWPMDGNKPKQPPNFGPCETPPFDEDVILQKLCKHAGVDRVTMANNLAEYRGVAETLAARTS